MKCKKSLQQLNPGLPRSFQFQSKTVRIIFVIAFFSSSNLENLGLKKEIRLKKK